jgi:hypothetical protein
MPIATAARIVERPPCTICGRMLSGKQRMFCGRACKVRGQSNSVYAHQKMRAMWKKAFLLKAKGGACQRCGYSRCTRALTFHHRDPATKLFPLDSRNCSNRSPAVLEAEAAKCDLLCMNCHAEVEEELYVQDQARRRAGSSMVERSAHNA